MSPFEAGNSFRARREERLGALDGSGANRPSGRDGSDRKDFLSSRPDSTPDGGRSDIFEAELREIELTFSNAMQQLNACERDRGVPEPFEAEHDIGPGLDVAMVLLDQVVEIFRGPDLFVSSGSRPSAFISRTARCEAA